MCLGKICIFVLCCVVVYDFDLVVFGLVEVVIVFVVGGVGSGIVCGVDIDM